ncbi:MAG: cupredoxin domain-containing protein [Chloroflexi bacterium]|nr:cupredoxin domain-containing protein [Chloroflexota bacterium]
MTEAVDGVLQIALEDNFYTLNNLSVPLGETTTIEIVNDGTDIHNMRIAGPDGEFNTDDDSVSDPEQITAGSTATVDFTPTLAGTYTFQCDFHPAEQGGVIVVE